MILLKHNFLSKLYHSQTSIFKLLNSIHFHLGQWSLAMWPPALGAGSTSLACLLILPGLAYTGVSTGSIPFRSCIKSSSAFCYLETCSASLFQILWIMVLDYNRAARIWNIWKIFPGNYFQSYWYILLNTCTDGRTWHLEAKFYLLEENNYLSHALCIT